LSCEDTIKARNRERKFQDAPHPEREIAGVLSRTLVCLGNHGLTEIYANGCPRRNNRSQETKKVPRTAANVKYVESGAKSQRRKEFPRRRASALKKASAGSIQKVHKEAWVFGSIDLNPCVCERSRGHQGLSQSILLDAR
jgi:hypothetical protein